MKIYSVYWCNDEADKSVRLEAQFTSRIKAKSWIKQQEDKRFLVIEVEEID